MSRRPHVVFVNRVEPPAPGASGEMLADLAGALRERGWAVTTVTSDRPMPDGLAGRGLRGPAQARRLGARAAAADADAVVLMTDPPTLPLQAFRLARRAPVVVWSLDVYPEVAGALGVLPRWAVPAVGAPFRAARRRAAATVAIGGPMAERLRAQGAGRVETVPLWAPPSVGPRPRGPGPFVVLYSGTLGRAHPVGGVLGAARRLGDLPDVRFVFAVDGARVADARRQSRGLPSVRFEPLADRARLADHLGRASAHVVVQAPETRGLLVPSKVYGAAASGRPVVLMGPEDGEAAAVARSTGGAVFAVDDGAGLAAWVRAARSARPVAAAPPGLPTLDAAADAWDRLLRDVTAAGPAPGLP